MQWILLSLLAPAIYTVNNFVDKYVIERRIKDSRVLPLYSAAAATFLGTSLWFLTGAPLAVLPKVVALIAAGCLSFFALLLYFFALSRSQTSYVIALLQTYPVFTLFFSFFFFGKILTLWQIVGFFLVFFAVVFLSFNRAREEGWVSKAILAILAANSLSALAAILVDNTGNVGGFVPLLIYQSWGLGIGGLLLFCFWSKIRQAFFDSLKSVGAGTLLIIFGNESLFNLANAVTYLAISLGPVALVVVLGGTQVFYGIITGAALTTLVPGIFKEDLGVSSLARKVALSMMLFVGITIIVFSG